MLKPSINISSILGLFSLGVLLVLVSCNKNKEETQPSNTPMEESVKLTFSDSVFYLEVGNETQVPFYTFYPNADGPAPLLVVLHGCGGLLKAENSDEFESHFNYWVDWGRENGFVVVLPDSFNPRGFSEFCGVAPPLDSVCSPAYTRPLDVLAGLDFFSQQKYIDQEKIVLLGFSHGGSTVLSSLFDVSIGTDKDWTVSANGHTYSVPSPVDFSTHSIAAAVSYYPGAGFYGYFGSTQNPALGAYRPSAPLLIHAAELDPLYSNGNTEVFVERAILNGASEVSNTEVILVVHESANHSFDGKTNGEDAVASEAARKQTADWLIDKLGL